MPTARSDAASIVFRCKNGQHVSVTDHQHLHLIYPVQREMPGDSQTDMYFGAGGGSGSLGTQMLPG